jgi:hypothetical protein
MYESLRPTNELAEAANQHEPFPARSRRRSRRYARCGIQHRQLRARGRSSPVARRAQQQRTANFVLQSADPSGINAAGPGSNIGQAVVYRFAGEILMRAWRDTRNEKYFAGFEEKVRKVLDVKPRFSDDFSNRIIFLKDLFPVITSRSEARPTTPRRS